MAISLRLRPTKAKQTKIGGLGTKMSKPGLYREASHSGSWYSASGNCQYSSVGVSMLYASCVIFLCFYFVFWLSLCYIDVLRRLTVCGLRILKQYPIKTITCCKKLRDITRALTLTSIDLKSLLLCLTFIFCWQPIPFGSRWSQAYSAIPPHTVNVNDWKQEQSFLFDSYLWSLYLLTWLTLQNFLACLLCC